ncbi:MAG: bifunctional 2-C-methyl-D-erythritol 4-phosphate cytidylyltransferase/2-C-methyl-D-erythritol 2,4-cyclodiphosphate synthase [Oceanicaulis sp.]|nr:bifunctional 2-C-methyl-D-erythritol 4-phosphate cytidylyltransferase/2-C-methyl-D-erythritol 2,4-cyclodiphosphate synthase [Oceanicaulis sp.]
MTVRFSACIMAAGSGTRAGGGEPKQLRALAGRPVLAWSAQILADHPACDELIVVHAPGQREAIMAALGDLSARARFASGGATRSAAVRAGLAAVTGDHVLIHDAARPFLNSETIDALLAALEDAPGAVPALPVADALAREADDGLTPVGRDGLMRLQTPQAFRTDALRAAFEAAGGADFPDETALARAQGLDVRAIPGDEMNFKLTWPADFDRAERLMAGPGAETVTGTGFDVHRLAPGDGLHLCGVFIASDLRLVGHSDADAGLHALTDAILGAAALGDIGDHFPPSDMQWKGADSARFLTHALALAGEAGLTPVHCDVTLICERPKIGPHKAAMKARLAALMGLRPERVNIKATTTEGLGFTGRGEGLAAQAAVTMRTK